MKEVKEVRTRTIPYEEEASTRVRTYQENYEEIVQYTQTAEIDYGLDVNGKF